MRKPFVASLALSLLGAAGPAFAGTVYVPVPDPVGATGSSHAMQVWITNSGAQQGPYKATFLDAGNDGTKRPAPSAETPVPAARTVLLGGLGVRGRVGMVEIDATSQMSIEARLVNVSPSGQTSVSAVPVISSENLFEAGRAAVLQGLGRDDARGDTTSLGIVNLAKQGAQCEVRVHRADGSAITAATTLTFAPLSLAYFGDAFGLLGVQKVADARILVTCNQPFYTFATIFLQSNSQIVFVTPSASGASTLTGPGGGGGDSPPVAGAFVYTIPGLFHTVTEQKPKDKREIVLPRDLSLRRLVLDLDFVPGPWNREKVPGNHGLVWLYRARYRSNTIANINAFSPPKMTLKAAQNINLPPKSSTQEEAGIPWEQGRRYHLKYTYDAEHGTVLVVLSSEGAVVRSFSYDSTAPGNVLTIPAKGLTVDFGHYPGQEGPEVANYGWTYYDFRVEMVPY
ncbi:MAG TPA: hypothetical protein VGG03_03820 [Thermoanaerobaculia bacterium]|jgi:hypothetical protein